MREFLGLSQERFAKKFQGAVEGEPLTRRAVMKWEDGEGAPSIPRLLRLTQVLKEEEFCLPDQVVLALFRASEDEWRRLYEREVAWKARGQRAIRESEEQTAPFTALNTGHKRDGQKDPFVILRNRCNWYWEWLCEREEERLLSEVCLPFDIPDAVYDQVYSLAAQKADEEWEDPATWNSTPVDWDAVFKHEV